MIDKTNINGIIVRNDSEFNIQAELFMKLREIVEPMGFKVFGEVRLMGEEKIGGARRQKGRLDIAIFKNNNIVCAIEVKNKKINGWRKQNKLYTKLGIPKMFLCFRNIENTIKQCKDYLTT